MRVASSERWAGAGLDIGERYVLRLRPFGLTVGNPGDTNGDGLPGYVTGTAFLGVGENKDQGVVYVYLSQGGGQRRLSRRCGRSGYGMRLGSRTLTGCGLGSPARAGRRTS